MEQGDALLPQLLTSWTRVCVQPEAVIAVPAVLICLRLVGTTETLSGSPCLLTACPAPPPPTPATTQCHPSMSVVYHLITVTLRFHAAQHPVSVCHGLSLPSHTSFGSRCVQILSTRRSASSSITQHLGTSMPATWLHTPQRSQGRDGSQSLPPSRSQARTEVQAISKA